jgi:hypothetical protein
VTNVLINTAACNTADAMAFEKAKLGKGAKVIDIRRKTWDSHDLAYTVQGTNGTRADVVVTSSALKRRLASAKP